MIECGDELLNCCCCRCTIETKSIIIIRWRVFFHGTQRRRRSRGANEDSRGIIDAVNDSHYLLEVYNNNNRDNTAQIHSCMCAILLLQWSSQWLACQYSSTHETRLQEGICRPELLTPINRWCYRLMLSIDGKVVRLLGGSTRRILRRKSDIAELSWKRNFCAEVMINRKAIESEFVLH